MLDDVVNVYIAHEAVAASVLRRAEAYRQRKSPLTRACDVAVAVVSICTSAAAASIADQTLTQLIINPHALRYVGR